MDKKKGLTRTSELEECGEMLCILLLMLPIVMEDIHIQMLQRAVSNCFMQE